MIKLIEVKYIYIYVTYWPSTEPSIKRCTCVTGSRCIRSRMSEYHRDIWTWLNSVQMRTPTGSRWTKKQLYNQVPQTAWVSSVQFELQFQLGIRCRSENQFQTEGLGLQDPGWAAQQNEEEVLLWSEELGVNMWQSLSVSNSPLTHNQHQPFRNPFANKVWEVYFSKEVCSVVIIVDYVSACICIRTVVSWLYNILIYTYMYLCVCVCVCVLDSYFDKVTQKVPYIAHIPWIWKFQQKL